MKKITAFLLVILLLMIEIVLSSCADKTDPADSLADTVADTSESADTNLPNTVEETVRYPDPVPELNLGNDTITFLVMGEAYTAEWISRDVFAENDSTDPIESAVFRRNKTLEEKYKCKIAEYRSNDTFNDAKKDIISNTHEYKVLMCCKSDTLGLARNNLLQDLNDINGLDLSNPWWDQNLVENCSIGGRLFFATGDISVMDNDATWVMMFNKKLIEKYDLESPYKLVEENRWTFDKMYEMMQKAHDDNNGNGKIDYDSDTFGFVTHDSSLDAFFYAAGLKVIAKDQDDMPYFPELNSEQISLVLDKSIKIWCDKTITSSATRDGYSMMDLQKIFQEGRSLFFGEVMQLVFRLREMDIDFGLIPFPKFDSKQKNYGHFVHGVTALLSIPVNSENVEKIGMFVEAMAYESMYTLTPAYYETALVGKYFRDPESGDMLTIILNSRTFDLGSTHMFNWGSVGSLFGALLSRGSKTYASKYKGRIEKGKKELEKDIEKLLQ